MSLSECPRLTKSFWHTVFTKMWQQTHTPTHPQVEKWLRNNFLQIATLISRTPTAATAVWPEFYFYTQLILLMLRKTWSGLRHKEAREPTGFQFSVSQLMDQSGFSFGLSGSSRGGGGGGGGALERDVRSSPQAQRTATGWTSSAAGRCSSDTVRSQTARGTQEKEGDISATCFFFFFKCFFSLQRRQRARGVLWAVWRPSSSRSCSARPLRTASSAPCSRTSPCWAVEQNVQHNVSLLARTNRGEQIRTWKARRLKRTNDSIRKVA